MKELQPGTKIKIKPLDELLKITGIKIAMERGGWQTKLPSGITFKAWMIGLYGCRMEIESVCYPESMNRPSYSLKGSRGNVWVSDEMFDLM